MKKYVFITFAAAGIGGTQIYVRNKLLFLREKGYDVTVIVTEPPGGQKVVVKELEPYVKNCFPELTINPRLYTKRRRNAILERIAGIIGAADDDEVIIETNFIMVTLWGELLAERMGAKHFILLIQEDYSLKDRRFLDFYSWKYDRGELAANTPHALKMLFDGYREIPESRHGGLSAFCSNTVEDCISDHEDAVLGQEADYRIGSVGRVNKPFVIPMIKDVIAFAGSHADKRFQLVLFGGTPDPEEEKAIYALTEPVPNLEFYMTGPIFPVPLGLLRKMDVFISSAGAAETSASAGLTTIVIDANDFEPIGVLGYTTNATVHRDPNLPHESTAALLEKILFDGMYPHDLTRTVEVDLNRVFEPHLTYFADAAADSDKEYYDISRTSPRRSAVLLYRIFGQKAGAALYRLLRGR